MPQASRYLQLAVLALALSACTDTHPVAPAPRGSVTTASGDAKLIVEIPASYLFGRVKVEYTNLTAEVLDIRLWEFEPGEDGFYGVITLPPGENRRIVISGLVSTSSGWVLSHRGEYRFPYVTASGNPRVSVRLDDVSGPPFIAVSATVGHYRVRVTPAVDSIDVRHAVPFTASVLDPDGLPPTFYGFQGSAWSLLTPELGSLNSSTRQQPWEAALISGRAAGTARVRFCFQPTYCAEGSVRLTDHGYVALSAGGNRTCAIKPSGKTYCWGEGLRVPALVADPAYLSAVDLGGGYLSAGDNSDLVRQSQACGISAVDNRTYCWKSNAFGQLGLGYASDSVPNPTPLDTAGRPRFTQLSVGVHHSCAIAVGGTAYCWGAGGFGQLGTGVGGPQDLNARALVPAPVSGGVAFTSISAGANHSCAVATDNRVYCWGGIASGWSSDSRTPSPMPTSLRFRRVSSGASMACGITTGDLVACWGYGGGNFGRGYWQPESSDTAIFVDALYSRFTAVAIGNQHSCALTTSRELYCWGDNAYGQAGEGEWTDELPSPSSLAGLRATAVAAGEYHTCAIEEGTFAARRVTCWGKNDVYQLGNGGTANHYDAEWVRSYVNLPK